MLASLRFKCPWRPNLSLVNDIREHGLVGEQKHGRMNRPSLGELAALSEDKGDKGGLAETREGLLR